MLSYLRYWLDCFYAWRRGERRIAPRGVRGRVYERRDGKPRYITRAFVKGKVTMRPTGYYCAAEDRWYDIDEKGNRTPREVK